MTKIAHSFMDIIWGAFATESSLKWFLSSLCANQITNITTLKLGAVIWLAHHDDKNHFIANGNSPQIDMFQRARNGRDRTSAASVCCHGNCLSIVVVFVSWFCVMSSKNGKNRVFPIFYPLVSDTVEEASICLSNSGWELCLDSRVAVEWESGWN